ncbi:hypothetical protein EYF80_007286 [Liparis tanakae]|uniref:Uncharacterized protein n=1 Tax=Liparis tanakae TaxID=230148 RepID=A0A4Z2IXG1_9TELE|nr:hypothetical protein EYF80_007286 [Liparis tanakae]
MPAVLQSRGLGAVACCSHSSPSGSHWPCTGPFSSSLDGRYKLDIMPQLTHCCLGMATEVSISAMAPNICSPNSDTGKRSHTILSQVALIKVEY